MTAVKLSPQAKLIIEAGSKEAMERGNSHFGTEHLLLGLLANEDDLPAPIFSDHVTYEEVSKVVDRVFKGEINDRTPEYTPRMKTVLEAALGKSVELGSPDVEPVHLALGLISCAADDDYGVASRVLEELEADRDEIEADLMVAYHIWPLGSIE